MIPPATPCRWLSATLSRCPLASCGDADVVSPGGARNVTGAADPGDDGDDDVATTKDGCIGGGGMMVPRRCERRWLGLLAMGAAEWITPLVWRCDGGAVEISLVDEVTR